MLQTAIYFGTEYTYGCIPPSHVSIDLHTFTHLCKGYLNISPTQTVQLKHLSVFFMSLMSLKANDMSCLNIQCRSRSHFQSPAPAFLSWKLLFTMSKQRPWIFYFLSLLVILGNRDHCGVQPTLWSGLNPSPFATLQFFDFILLSCFWFGFLQLNILYLLFLWLTSLLFLTAVLLPLPSQNHRIN